MKHIGLLLAMGLLLSACQERDKNGRLLDSPTSGTIKIAVDESLKPLVDTQVKAFEAIYTQAKIEVAYMDELSAITSMLADSARIAVITRTLSDDEKKILTDQTILPSELTVARGGVAIIRNRHASDSVMTLVNLKALLSGTAIPSDNMPSKVVFDTSHSGIVRFLQATLALDQPLAPYCFAVQGNAAVVHYVSNNADAIGLIDVSWISDRDDSTANRFLNSIKVVSLSSDSGYYQPYQAYIAQHKYPLVRDIIMISREARMGLASGFMSFVASDRGQRIVLKSGLVPATMPIRIVEINQEPF